MNPERFAQVDRVLQSVLERPAQERDAFLDEACGTDAALKNEVRSLLASYDESGSFIQQPAAQDGARLMAEERMASLIGQVIGNYKIVEPIGAGGMGEVYLAADTRNSRPTALKILLAYLTTDAERVRRFQQEARAVLALNHPNIVTIYEIGQAAGVNFIATELIKGQTLRQLMTRQPLSLGEALDVSIQIASALVYAHDQGVIHRDIKPENIMLRPDGYVKVLDFGIAKLTERQATPTDPNEAQTRMKVETSPGVVMGTAHYMSPEQARGKKVDERTDTWSLGAVLYELLTGRPPFEGETPSDIIGLILQRDPAPLSALMSDAPPELERMVSKALDKSQDERYQTAKDFLADLRRFKRRYEHEADVERSMPPSDSTQVAVQVSTGGQQASATGAGEAATSTAVAGQTLSSAEYIVSEFKRHRTGILIGVAAFILIVAAGGFLSYKYLNRNGSASTQAVKITPLPVNGVMSTWRNPSISPDGKYVVYLLLTHNEKGEEENSMWEMYRPTGDVKQILPPSSTHDYGGLSFANDGDYVYYWDTSSERHQTSLYKVSLIGGVPKKLIDNMKSTSFVPSPDGKQLALARYEGKDSPSIFVANEDGTGERLLATRDCCKEWLGESPAWSADGKSIACFLYSNAGGGHVSLLIVNVADGTQKEMDKARWLGATGGAWLHDGSGLLVTAAENRAATLQVWYVSYPDGAMHRITNDLNDYSLGTATADSRTLLAVQRKNLMDVWVMPVGGEASQPPRQLTFTKSDGQLGVAWTPDGKIVFTAMTGSVRDLWVMNADGTNRRQITSGTENKSTFSVSPDGRFLVFRSNLHLWRVDMDGSNLKQLTFGNDEEQFPRITPDGNWVIFSTWRTGKITPWRVPVDGGEPTQLSDRQLMCKDISPNGKLILCGDYSQQQGKSKIVLLPIEGGEPVKVIEWPDHYTQPPGWTADGSAITLLTDITGLWSLWKFPLDGSPPKQLTNFNVDSLNSYIDLYAFSRDGKTLAFVRSNHTSDLVLITDFK